MKAKLTLPMPPTVNHYYGRSKTGIPYLTKKAKGYRHDVAVIVNNEGHRGKFGRQRLGVCVTLFFASGGDIDNRMKPLLDALEEANLFHNDRQIDDLRIIRGHRVKGGRCEVTIWRM